jgi:ankyrin repeat protein
MGDGRGTTEAGRATLVKAATSGGLASVDALLSRRMYSVEQAGELDMAIMSAAARRDFPVVQRLLDVREQIAAPLEPLTVLSVARYAPTDLVRRVFALVQDPVQVNHLGRTALHAAAQGGNTEVAALLLELGADPNAIEITHANTPLHTAVRWGQAAAASQLLAAGADPEALDNDGLTPLALADMDGHEDVVAVLIRQGADPTTRHLHGRTALHRAAASGTLARVRHELATSTAGINHQDRWGETPLHLAARRSRPDAARLMLEAGADVNVQNHFGETPLVVAATSQQHGSSHTVRMLLGYHTDPNLATDDGRTALHTFVVMEDPELLQLAIDRGGDLEHRDADGRTPLLGACTYPSAACLKVLVDAGADPTVRDSENRSAADLLIRWGALDADSERQAGAMARLLGWAIFDWDREPPESARAGGALAASHASQDS